MENALTILSFTWDANITVVCFDLDTIRHMNAVSRLYIYIYNIASFCQIVEIIVVTMNPFKYVQQNS